MSEFETMAAMIRRLLAWWKRRRCKHVWRPAVSSRGPAKYCDRCETTVRLDAPEFYAVFGRMPWNLFTK